MRLFIYTVVLVFSLPASGQITFYNDYTTGPPVSTGDICFVKPTFDGGYIALMKGLYVGSIQYDGAIIKTDALGSVTWSHLINDTIISHTFYNQNIIQSQDSSFFCMLHCFESAANTDRAIVIKLNKNGQLLWKKRYSASSSAPSHIISDGSNGFVFTAQLGQSTITLTHCDSNGSIIWEKGYNSGIIRFALPTVTRISSGGYAIYGIAANTQTMQPSALFLMRTDVNGNSINCNYFDPGPQSEWTGEIQELSNGDLLLCGYTHSFCQTQGNTTYLIKTSASGSIRWFKTYSCGVDIHNVIPGSPTSLAFFGGKNGSFLLAEGDSSGVIQNARVTGTWASNYTTGFIHQTHKAGSGFIVSGGNGPGFLVKLDSTRSGFCQSTPILIDSYPWPLSDSIIFSSAFNSTMMVVDPGYLNLIPGGFSSTLICSNIITGTESLSSIPSFVIKSNLIHDILEIESNIDMDMEIVDIHGKLLYKSLLTQGSHTIDLSYIASGVFLLHERKSGEFLRFVKW